jgi:hypothetical protein
VSKDIPDRKEAAAIPEGMVPWHGGDSAPDDWDGGWVLCDDGEMYTPPLEWASPSGGPDIIAYTPKPASTGVGEPSDTDLLNAIRDECWDLRSFDVPTGGDDVDVAWRVVGHWQAEPRERVIAEEYSHDPRVAIRAAMKAGDPETFRALSQPPLSDSGDDRLREALAVGERFLDKCYSAWSCGEPSHRVKAMLDAADEFRATLNVLPAALSQQPADTRPISDPTKRMEKILDTPFVPTAPHRGEG